MMDEAKFLEWSLNTPKEEKILRFIRKEGVVDLYPIIEFFSGDAELHNLIAAGLVIKEFQPDKWHRYRLTPQGEAHMAALPPIPGFD